MSDLDLDDEKREFVNTITRFAREAIQIEWSLESADRFVDALAAARAELDQELVDYGIWLVFVSFMMQRVPTPHEAAAMGIDAQEYAALLRSVPSELWPTREPQRRVLH